MCFGKSGSYCTGDHGGGNHLTYSIDSYHQAAADDNVMATHQIFNIFSISEQSYKCCHKEQRIQKCGKKSGHSTGYISIADFTHTSEDVSQADTIEKSWYKSLDKSKYRIDTKKHNSHRTGVPHSVHCRNR